MQTHLILQKGEKRHLLLRSTEALHLITMDRRLTDQTEDWLLAQPRTVEEMNKRQLSRSTIELKNLRGYSVTGLEAGDTLQIYTKEGKRRYQLAVACPKHDLNSLFRGFTRFNPPKPIDWKAWEDSRDWRTPRQDEEKRKQLHFIALVLDAVSLVSCFAGLVFHSALNGVVVLCLLCLILSLGLYALYPSYYTIFEEKSTYHRGKVIGIYVPVLLCPVVLCAVVLDHSCVLNWGRAWLFGTAAAVLLTVLFWKRSPEMREPTRLIGFLLVAVLVSTGPVLTVNYLLDFSPVQEIHAEVVNMDQTSGRGGTWNHIHVCLDGETYEIPVSGSVYSGTSVGQRVEVELHSGALGIPYAKID